MEIITRTQDLISEGKTEKALNQLQEFFLETNNDLHSATVLLSGQYQKWEREKNLGIIKEDLELRRIENAILDLLRSIKENDHKHMSDAETEEVFILEQTLKEIKRTEKRGRN